MSLAEARPAAKPDNIPSAAELVGRARKLAPKLRERALKAERDRNIPRKSVEEYIDAGLIHALQPKRWGGYEHDHEIGVRHRHRARQIDLRLIRVVSELSRPTTPACSRCFRRKRSTTCGASNKAACIATSAAPTGKITVVPGGYRLDGRWSWCSGLRHSHWIMIGGLAFRAGEDHPDMRLYLVPVSELKHGRYLVLRGPARAPARLPRCIDDVFVPEHRSVSFADCCATPARPVPRSTTNPIYRTPFIAVHSYALMGPALGVARGGYADFVQCA